MQVTNTLELSAVVWREDRIYVALCPELDVASQGKSVEEALRNLKEALELYLEDEDVEKPSKAEAPMVTMVKVDVSGGWVSMKAKEELLERIVVDPKVMVGKPVIRGTRITVKLVLTLLAQGLNVEKILKDYPHLTRDDVAAVLLYAAKD